MFQGSFGKYRPDRKFSTHQMARPLGRVDAAKQWLRQAAVESWNSKLGSSLICIGILQIIGFGGMWLYLHFHPRVLLRNLIDLIWWLWDKLYFIVDWIKEIPRLIKDIFLFEKQCVVDNDLFCIFVINGFSIALIVTGFVLGPRLWNLILQIRWPRPTRRVIVGLIIAVALIALAYISPAIIGLDKVYQGIEKLRYPTSSRFGIGGIAIGAAFVIAVILGLGGDQQREASPRRRRV